MGIFHVNFITSIEICAIFSFFTRNLLVKLIIKKKCWNVYLKRALNLLSHKSGLCVCVQFEAPNDWWLKKWAENVYSPGERIS